MDLALPSELTWLTREPDEPFEFTPRHRWRLKQSASGDANQNTRLNWNPVLHPRSPRTGLFVNRPWDLPELFSGVGGSSVRELVDASSFNRHILDSAVWQESRERSEQAVMGERGVRGPADDAPGEEPLTLDPPPSQDTTADRESVSDAEAGLEPDREPEYIDGVPETYEVARHQLPKMYVSDEVTDDVGEMRRVDSVILSPGGSYKIDLRYELSVMDPSEVSSIAPPPSGRVRVGDEQIELSEEYVKGADWRMPATARDTRDLMQAAIDAAPEPAETDISRVIASWKRDSHTALAQNYERALLEATGFNGEARGVGVDGGQPDRERINMAEGLVEASREFIGQQIDDDTLTVHRGHSRTPTRHLFASLFHDPAAESYTIEGNAIDNYTMSSTRGSEFAYMYDGFLTTEQRSIAEMAVAHGPLNSPESFESEVLFANGKREVSRSNIQFLGKQGMGVDEMFETGGDREPRVKAMDMILSSLRQDGDRWTPTAIRNLRRWLDEFGDGAVKFEILQAIEEVEMG
jgi:hypothetical protein